jgi:hypothetical protein
MKQNQFLLINNYRFDSVNDKGSFQHDPDFFKLIHKQFTY